MVVGKDLISRLSLTTAKRLVDDMVMCLACCRRPKLFTLVDLLLGRHPEDKAVFCSLPEVSDDVLGVLQE